MKEGNLPIREFFKDTFSAMKMRGKLSVLSGAVTAWGVFIFVLIVGIGSGFNRGLSSNFDFFLEYGMITISPGEVSIPANGLPKGRRISFTEDDADFIRAKFSDRAEHVYQRKMTKAVCGSTTGTSIVSVCDFRDGLDGNYIHYLAGFEMSKLDISQGSRVCLIPKNLCNQLFDSPAEAVGSTIQVDGIPFLVNGVYEAQHKCNINCVYIPYAAAMTMRGTTNEISSIEVKIYRTMLVKDKIQLRDDIREAMSRRKNVDNTDLFAIHIEEQLEYISTQDGFVVAIRVFTIILGIMSLLMGIIGISSIINLSVKERTREIAIRMVCGSSERSIFALVLGEAVLTMLTFGSLGIILASILLHFGTVLTTAMNADAEWVVIGDMGVSFTLVLVSICLIFVCGVLAGYSPARKAVSIDINKALTSL